MPYTFVAESPKAALEKIHRQLGPDAVVFSVRPLPPRGVTRLWHRPTQVEIVAGLPETAAPPAQSISPEPDTRAAASSLLPSPFTLPPSHWPTVAWLEGMGLLPDFTERLQRRLQSLHPIPPSSPETEWAAVRAALISFWPPNNPAGTAGTNIHVFIGPPGSGKTTALCKWLTLATLTEGRSARAWRLDGIGANTAELLTLHCELLGVPLERIWSPPVIPADLLFIDLPGIETDDPRALEALQAQLSTLPSPSIHLVLNAAYQIDLLLAQCRAFAAFQPHDLILTHLDEHPRPVKLWNLMFAIRCPIAFLSASSKIPGLFHQATPELLLANVS